jgi:hypothetical protein
VGNVWSNLTHKLEDNKFNNNNNNNFIQNSMFGYATGHVPELSNGVVWDVVKWIRSHTGKHRML